MSIKNMIQTHGRKALMLYLLWCLAKGIFFLFAGAHLLKKYTLQQPATIQPTMEAKTTRTIDTEQLSVLLGDGNMWLAGMTLFAIIVVSGAVRWIGNIMRRDYEVGAGNRFLEEMDGEMYR